MRSSQCPRRFGGSPAPGRQCRVTQRGGVEAASMLLKQLIRDEPYRSFRRYNPWLFGARDQFPPRVESLR